MQTFLPAAPGRPLTNMLGLYGHTPLSCMIYRFDGFDEALENAAADITSSEEGLAKGPDRHRHQHRTREHIKTGMQVYYSLYTMNSN